MSKVTPDKLPRDGTGFRGLLARWRAEHDDVNEAELHFFRRAIEQNGQPALDLACGTGRILVHLVKHGLEVHGCEASVEMINFCQERGETEGIIPVTFVQEPSVLDLPQKYCTILMCDSFGLTGSRKQELECVRRVARHLEPGGAFVFNHSIPSGDSEVWRYWLPERQTWLPQPWPSVGERRTLATGEELELRSRIEAIDVTEQRVTRAVRIALYADGKKQREEEHFVSENYYFRKELEMFLAEAGFETVTIRDGYSEDPARFDCFDLGVIARMPW